MTKVQTLYIYLKNLDIYYMYHTAMLVCFKVLLFNPVCFYLKNIFRNMADFISGKREATELLVTLFRAKREGCNCEGKRLCFGL